MTPGDQFNITLRNGTIQGMGNSGISLVGASHLVEYMHVRSNGNDGIAIEQRGISIPPGPAEGPSIVQHNTAQLNSRFAITLTRGLVSHNVADLNGTGIGLVFGTASHNVVTGNVGDGLSLNLAASYIGNTLNGNGINVTNGKNLGQNLCGTTVCPSSAF